MGPSRRIGAGMTFLSGGWTSRSCDITLMVYSWPVSCNGFNPVTGQRHVLTGIIVNVV
jgi:hypothetical protein